MIWNCNLYKKLGMVILSSCLVHNQWRICSIVILDPFFTIHNKVYFDIHVLNLVIQP